MARMIVDGPDLVVRLSPLGKLGAFRGDVRVPLRTVRSVCVELHPWSALRGIRGPGTGIPGMIALDTRRFPGGEDFAAIEGRRPAVRADLAAESPFGRLVVPVRDPENTVAAIRGIVGV